MRRACSGGLKTPLPWFNDKPDRVSQTTAVWAFGSNGSFQAEATMADLFCLSDEHWAVLEPFCPRASPAHAPSMIGVGGSGLRH